MTVRKDWLKRPLPELNVMFANVDGKIDGYKVAYGLTQAWIDRVKLICETFTGGFAGVMENRATMKDLNKWFEHILNGTPRGATAPLPPSFADLVMKPDAFIGLIAEFREMMGFFKANAAYIEADGENLMILAEDEDEDDISNAAPELKVSTDADEKVRVSYVRGDFGGLELQWRVDGQTMWQLADKSTEKIVEFEPTGITPPQKIELRAVFLLKNQRVGQWSPIYPLTVG